MGRVGEAVCAARDVGTDDYLIRPINSAELVARIRVVLQRRIAGSPLARFGALTFDLVHRQALADGASFVLR